MIPLMVKETDLDRIDVPEDYEVLDARALGRLLGFKRDTCPPSCPLSPTLIVEGAFSEVEHSMAFP
jgi:hypothetical protein